MYLLRPWTVAVSIICLSAVLSIPPCIGAARAGKPAHAADGWRVSSPEAQGLDSVLLDEACSSLEKTDATSLIIVRHGNIVLERYFRGQRPGDFCFSGSAANLLLSALVGISIQKGEIRDADQKVMEFFPEYMEKLTDSRAADITLEQLMAMTAGYGPFPEELGRSMDWVGSQLALPLLDVPGKSFYHSPGAYYLLSGVLTRAAGRSALELARERMFKPLGIPYAIWHTGPEKYNIAGDYLYMKPLDIAKLGMLYLDRGSWNGIPVIPGGWAEKTLGVHASAADAKVSGLHTGSTGYGYGVAASKVGNFTVYTAEGSSGVPALCMIPALDISLVISSYPTILRRSYGYGDLPGLLEKYLLPAVSPGLGSFGDISAYSKNDSEVLP